MKRVLFALITALILCSLTVISADYEFIEDFDSGLSIFSSDGGYYQEDSCAVTLSDDKMYSLSLLGKLPKNATLEIRFRTDATKGWFGIFLQDGSVPVCRILMRSIGIHKYPSAGEQGLKYTNIDPDTFYDLKIVPEQNESKIYYKNASVSTYSYAGAIAKESTNAPSFSFTSCYTDTSIDSVKIYKSSFSALEICEAMVKIETGSTYTLNLNNEKSADVAWSSSNSSVATVNNGVITAVAPGAATISATAGTSTTEVAVICYTKPTSLELKTEDITLTVGDAVEQQMVVNPANCINTAFVWTSSDESVARVYKVPNSNSASIIAEGEGVALVTIESADRSLSTEFEVVVYPKNDNIYTENAIFNVTGDSHSIPEGLFGTHTNPADVSEVTTNAINEISFNSLRAFYRSSVDTEKYYRISNQLSIPIIVELSEFPTATVEELMESVKLAKANAKANDTILIEMGNECYDGQMSVSDYIAKGKLFYKAVKDYDPTIKVSAVITDTLLQVDLKSWNAALKNEDFFDAVSVHIYSEFSSYRSLNQSQAVNSVFASNVHYEREFYTIAEMFPGKEIWVTEYGFLLFTVFRQSNDYEKSRLQWAKNPGISLTNVEKVLSMARTGLVQYSNYHIINDSQGFGIVQGDSKNPNYYAFKEIGRLFDTYDTFYNVSPIKTDVFNTPYLVKGNTFAFADFVMDKVDCWGFGDKNGIREVVILNRSDKEVTYSLKDYAISKSWSFGGINSFDGYLSSTDNWLAPYTKFTLPETFGPYTDITVTLKPYSMTVCDVYYEPGLITIGTSVYDSQKDVSVYADIKLTPSHSVDADILEKNITFTDSKGHNVEYDLKANDDNTFVITSKEALLYDSQYTLVLGDNIGNERGEIVYEEKTIKFTTEKEPRENSFVPYFSKAGICNSSSKNLPRDYEITYELTFTGTTPSSRFFSVYHFFLYDNTICYYKNKYETNYICGHYNFEIGKVYNIKFTAIGPTLTLYAKEKAEREYTKISQIDNRPVSDTNSINFFNGDYTIKNLNIKVPGYAKDKISYTKQSGGKFIEIASLMNGTNYISSYGADHTDIAVLAIYKNGKLESAETKPANSEFEVFISGKDTGKRRFFVFDSILNIMPVK